MYMNLWVDSELTVDNNGDIYREDLKTIMKDKVIDITDIIIPK